MSFIGPVRTRRRRAPLQKGREPLKRITPSSRRGGRFAVAALALVGLAALAVPALSSAATIYIKGNSTASLHFVGPTKIHQGELLQIVNQSNAKAVGPQTFSLVEASEIPKGATVGQCDKKGHICKSIEGWHGIKNGGKPKHALVSVGGEGWGTAGSTTSKGDSWYTSKKGQSVEQVVYAGATAGAVKLSFMSAFDPALHGSIMVLPQ